MTSQGAQGYTFPSPAYWHRRGGVVWWWGSDQRLMHEEKGTPTCSRPFSEAFLRGGQITASFPSPLIAAGKRGAQPGSPHLSPAGGDQDKGGRPRPLNTHRRSPLSSSWSLRSEGTGRQAQSGEVGTRTLRTIQECQNPGRAPWDPTEKKISGILLPSPTTSLGGMDMGSDHSEKGLKHGQ